jgi:hypothetical protein
VFRVKSIPDEAVNWIKRHNTIRKTVDVMNYERTGGTAFEKSYRFNTVAISVPLLLHTAVGKGTTWGTWRDLAAPPYHLTGGTASLECSWTYFEVHMVRIQTATCKGQKVLVIQQGKSGTDFFININTMISLGRQETAFDFFR